MYRASPHATEGATSQKSDAGLPLALAIGVGLALALAIAGSVPPPGVPGVESSTWTRSGVPVSTHLTDSPSPYLRATPAGGIAPLRVALTVVNLTLAPARYEWSFGDGSFWNTTSPSGGTVEHLYTFAGRFNATVEMPDLSVPVVCNVTVVVSNGPIAISMSPSTTEGVAPLTVEFNGTISGGSGTYQTVSWDFGTGDAGSGIPVTYTFTRPGQFLVRLTVEDSAGDTANWSDEITVRSPGSSGGGGLWSGGAVVPALIVGAGLGATAVGAIAIFLRRPVALDSVEEGRSDSTATGSAPFGADEGAPPGRIPAPSTVSTAVAPAGEPAQRSEGRVLVPVESPRPQGPRSPLAPPTGTTDVLSPGVPSVRLSRRVILHLASVGHLRDDTVAAQAMTQQGIGEALHARQNSVSGVLIRMEAAGILESHLRHVPGRNRRVKAYELTPQGDAIARGLRASRPGAPPPVP